MMLNNSFNSLSPIRGLAILRETTVLSTLTALGAGQIGISICKSLVERFVEETLGKSVSMPLKFASGILETTSLTSLHAAEILVIKCIEFSDRCLQDFGIEVGEELSNFIKSTSSPEVYSCFLVYRKVVENIRDHGTMSQVVRGLKLLGRIHSIEDIDFEESEPHPQFTLNIVHQWEYEFNCALASYGWRINNLIGIASEKSDEAVIKELSGADEILRLKLNADYCMPAYYVAIDHKKKNLIIALRGTLQIQDIVTDLVCEFEEFACQYSDDSEVMLNGKAHRGFLMSALKLSTELKGLIIESLQLYKDYSLILTGHSLGGGVATLLALLWAKEDVFKRHNIRCKAFGAPCTLSFDLASSPFAKKYVESITLNEDFVCRLSLGSVHEMYRVAFRLSETNENDIELHRKILHDAKEEFKPLKLFPAGLVWHLSSKNIKCSSYYDSIMLSPRMISVHFPFRYIAEIKKLKIILSCDECKVL